MSLFWLKESQDTSTFMVWSPLNLTIIFQLFEHSVNFCFAHLWVSDHSTLELAINFYLMACFQKLLCPLNSNLQIVVTNIWTKTQLFDFNFFSVLALPLFTLLLVIQELGKFSNPSNRRVGAH